jgi:hypothetical protein
MTPYEEEVIGRVVNTSSIKAYSYMQKEDLRNELWIICAEALESFDPERGDPLENYLRKVVSTRGVNRFKEITRNVTSPCVKCPFYKPNEVPGDCAAFGMDKHECDKWREYKHAIDSRNSLLKTFTVDPLKVINENSSIDNLVIKEEIKLLRENLSQESLHVMEVILTGGRVSKEDNELLLEESREILNTIANEPLDGNE